MKIGVIGAGKWGTALHFAFSKNREVKIFSRTPRDLPDFVTLNEILEMDYLVFAISTQSIAGWLKDNFKFKNQKILIASKGVDIESGRFLSQIFSDYIPEQNIAFLSGPSFSSEVLNSLPTALVVNSRNYELAEEWKSFFPDFIKAYTSSDIIGAEISGAYKNILAIASGVCEGLKLGNNAKASLVSRGLVEMARFGERFGGRKDTFLGLSGSGDLFLTANSTMSRNYRVGLGLAEGKNLDEILRNIGETAEGVKTVEAIQKIREREGLYTPIADEVYKLLYSESTPLDALKNLLN
jgi:glycerol-3-phosphate dehydrogenase (NAD(P)+)